MTLGLEQTTDVAEGRDGPSSYDLQVTPSQASLAERYVQLEASLHIHAGQTAFGASVGDLCAVVQGLPGRIDGSFLDGWTGVVHVELELHLAGLDEPPVKDPVVILVRQPGEIGERLVSSEVRLQRIEQCPVRFVDAGEVMGPLARVVLRFGDDRERQSASGLPVSWRASW